MHDIMVPPPPQPPLQGFINAASEQFIHSLCASVHTCTNFTTLELFNKKRATLETPLNEKQTNKKIP